MPTLLALFVISARSVCDEHGVNVDGENDGTKSEAFASAHGLISIIVPRVVLACQGHLL
jgi:hypothetical protein